MNDLDQHLSSRELLEFADGELDAKQADRVHHHLAACWTCRARSRELEFAITRFVELNQTSAGPRIPPPDGPRALLRARLAAEIANSERKTWRLPMVSRPWVGVFAGLAALAILVAGLAVLSRRDSSMDTGRLRVPSNAHPVPDRALTPGDVRPVNLREVCSESHSDKNRIVSAAMQREVFREYGISNSRPSDYEVDYLITPELGGSDDIRNLWPEPYTSTTWTASVKDALEDRLHEMVCDGRLDLGTAQLEISADWIGAYKKYFHTEKPLLEHASAPAEPSQSSGTPVDWPRRKHDPKNSVAS